MAQCLISSLDPTAREPLPRLTLTAAEAAALQTLVGGIARKYRSAEDPDFLAEAAVLGHELPRRLREALYSFRLHEPAAAILLISGLPVADEELGRTPAHWQVAASPPAVLALELTLILCSSILGECFGWRTQQGGNIIHNVAPIRGHEDEQIGTGSNQTIWWHTEDAFHPYRGDYVAMLCLRNPDRVSTTYAAFDSIELDRKDRERLFEEQYVIRPDESHRKAKGAAPGLAKQNLNDLYQQVEQMSVAPRKVAVLEGDPASPYIRIDPFFMDPAPDAGARRAMAALTEAVDAELMDVVLEPGDICFIDNFKAVHGRRSFTARHDGSDRWLKRINVARDLRRSRAGRASAASRIIL